MKKNSLNYGNIISTILLSIVGFLMALPFIWMVSTSLKASSEIFVFPPKFIPNQFMWGNYIEALNRIPFMRFFFNSYYIATIVTIGNVLLCALAGYAFARLRFKGRNFLFFAYLATMMIPIQVRIIPLYKMMINYNWVNNHLALIIPMLTFFSAWGTFLVRQFALSIPKELEESARLDGCNYIMIFYHIILPLMKPVLATLTIFTFVQVYNRFLWPLIVLNDMELKTLPLGIALFMNRIFLKTPWHLVMAAATMSVLPLLIVFILGQKYYIKGIATTGLKG